MLFSTGNIIRGEINAYYSVTNENMHAGIVTETFRRDGVEMMSVKIADHNIASEIGCEYVVCNDDSCFSLIKHHAEERKLNSISDISGLF